MRLIVPYLLLLMLVSAVALFAGSTIYAIFAALQVLGWIVAIAGLCYRIPVLHRVAAPAGALLGLNAAAVVGLYKFLFTPGPLWKIWNLGKLAAVDSTSKPEALTPSEPAAITSAIDVGKNS